MEEDPQRQDKKSKKGCMSKDEREQSVGKMAGLGRISKAIQAIVSPGLAADTPAVQQKVDAKLPRKNYA
eukprot:9941849-Karenia_brevis.AAC.1